MVQMPLARMPVPRAMRPVPMRVRYVVMVGVGDVSGATRLWAPVRSVQLLGVRRRHAPKDRTKKNAGVRRMRCRSLGDDDGGGGFIGISASPMACPLRGYGCAGTQSDRLGEAVIVGTGAPIPAQWACRRRRRYRCMAGVRRMRCRSLGDDDDGGDDNDHGPSRPTTTAAQPYAIAITI